MSNLQEWWDAAPELAERMAHAEAEANAEQAALRKDAERYRWMRKNAITLDDFSYYVDEEVEAFVDEQMAGAPDDGAA